ncbi:hypothetical protein CsSME_00026351 [Camellia sinensis var. sinensis]
MLSGEKAVPQQRILFLGGCSFGFEEEGEDSIGRRRLETVERGQGLRRAIVLCVHEVEWCRMAYLGCLLGGRRSVAVWISREGTVVPLFRLWP